MSDAISPTTSGSITVMPAEIWERYAMALDDIEQRKQRIVAALEKAGVRYALIGGQAVIAWVSTRDPAAVRTTKDVDIMLDRTDLPSARAAAQQVGLDYFEVLGIGMFLERTDPNPRHAVHIVWAGERVRPEHPLSAPTIEHAVELPQGQRVISLEGLVLMKLNAFRRHDQVHIADLVSVGLIDASWVRRVPAELAPRLQEILDNPEG